MGIELVPGPKDSDIEWDAKKEFIRSLEDATGEVLRGHFKGANEAAQQAKYMISGTSVQLADKFPQEKLERIIQLMVNQAGSGFNEEKEKQVQNAIDDAWREAA